MIPFDQDALRDDLTAISGIGQERAAEIQAVLEDHLAAHDEAVAASDIEVERLVRILDNAEGKLTDANRTAAFRMGFAGERIRTARDHLKQEANL